MKLKLKKHQIISIKLIGTKNLRSLRTKAMFHLLAI